MSTSTGQLFGNYQLIKVLGSGGFAEVYEGEHVFLQTRAAIKILHAKLADNQRAGFLNEAQTIARLQHEHIVRVLEFDVQEETPFLVMEYAPGGTLRDLFPKGKAIPLEQVMPIVQQVASALQYAHEQRLVHRDVKPENMLLGQENEVLLSDFGIALLLQSTNKSGNNEVVGTVSYMAPEQLRGQAQQASDQYALAIAVYEWLCGERPFKGSSFASIASQHLLSTPPALKDKAPHLPLAVTEAVHKALAKDPQQRFASVRDFAQALSQAASEAPITALDTSATPEPSSVITTANTARQELAQPPLSDSATPINTAQPSTPARMPTITRSAQPRRRMNTGCKVILFTALSLLLMVGGIITCLLALFFAPTITHTALNQNYQKLYLQATSGQPTIEDPLSMQNSLNWIGKCSFRNGSMHMPPGDECIATGFVGSDFAYQVEATVNAEKQGVDQVPGAFLAFRYSQGTSRAGTYYLDTYTNGRCGLGMRKDVPGSQAVMTYLVPLHICPSIHTSYHQPNVLTVIVQGTAIYAYINKQFVGTANDDTFSSGWIGMAADGASLDTEFKDVRIWNLSS